jgi:hypothetical protein
MRAARSSALLWLLVLPVVAVQAGKKFAAHTTCESCTAAGFGWSGERGKCGGYANKDCPAAAGGGKASPAPLHGGAAAAAPAAGGTGAAPAGAASTCLATDTDEKRGDDDDLLRMMGVRPKCSAMAEVIEHYTDQPYPPRDPEDERKRIVMDPNNTPVAIAHHLYNGQLEFPKASSGDPPFRLLVAGGGTGDATIMFAVSFTAAKLAFEIVHVDLSAASIGVAKQRLQIRGIKTAEEGGPVRFIQVGCCLCVCA